MSPDESRLLRDLLDRFAAAVPATLDPAPLDPAPLDPEADALVRAAVRAHPQTPLMMAQYLIVLEKALAHARGRIDAMETSNARPVGGGGFLGAIFGSGRGEGRGEARRGGGTKSGSGDVGGLHASSDHGASAGAFLTGAAAMALGVAGGGLIGDAIADLVSAESGTAGNDGSTEDDASDFRGGRDHGYGDGANDGSADADSGGGDSGGGDGE